jgi:hypothetical protein
MGCEDFASGFQIASLQQHIKQKTMASKLVRCESIWVSNDCACAVHIAVRGPAIINGSCDFHLNFPFFDLIESMESMK